jgi:hypothetical protein
VTPTSLWITVSSSQVDAFTVRTFKTNTIPMEQPILFFRKVDNWTNFVPFLRKRMSFVYIIPEQGLFFSVMTILVASNV